MFDITCDLHMHTTFSDGSASVVDMCLSAIDKGLHGIAITDHMPLPFDSRYAMRQADVIRYRQEIEAAKSRFGSKLEVKMGMEIEYLAEHADWIGEIHSLGWDYLIVSVHHLPGSDMLHLVNGHEHEFAPLFTEFRENPIDLCRRYFRVLQEAIATGLFTCVGHLDVLKKWQATFGHIDETADWYQRLIDDTLDCMVQYGIMMEINTAGLNHALGEQYPSNWIVVKAAKRKIPIVLGSDAHNPQSVGQHFGVVKERFCDRLFCERG